MSKENADPPIESIVPARGIANGQRRGTSRQACRGQVGNRREVSGIADDRREIPTRLITDSIGGVVIALGKVQAVLVAAQSSHRAGDGKPGMIQIERDPVGSCAAAAHGAAKLLARKLPRARRWIDRRCHAGNLVVNFLLIVQCLIHVCFGVALSRGPAKMPCFPADLPQICPAWAPGSRGAIHIAAGRHDLRVRLIAASSISCTRPSAARNAS